ncbi:IS110 family transposase, partial [Clostridium botulinum]|nr:IS110 family transposase [Clostridium botulinum]
MQINTPNDFEDISFSQLEKVLEKITFKKFTKDKIDSISKIAKNSFGITLGIDSFSFQLKLLIEQISFIEKQV